MSMDHLPIWSIRYELEEALESNQITVILGETGCGKNTQVSRIVLESHTGSVACTQPNRVAAMSLGCKVAEDMCVTIGDEVGYSTPYEDCFSAKIVLKYLTDDVLLREAMTYRLLEPYNNVCVCFGPFPVPLAVEL